jgi:hypothetical protein
MTNNKQLGRGPNTYIFSNTDAGRAIRNNVAASLASQGISTEKSIEKIGETLVLVLTVTGRRPGEGRIAADMKARRAC